jgi:hypothetical protein
MTLAGDFTSVLDDTIITIGDNSNVNGWTTFFKTEDRFANKKAYISLMVRKMSFTLDNKNAEVRLNNQKIGEIFNTNAGKNPDWDTQMITIDSSVLVEQGDNELTIFAVPNDNPSPGNTLDDYDLTQIVVHFHRNF